MSDAGPRLPDPRMIPSWRAPQRSPRHAERDTTGPQANDPTDQPADNAAAHDPADDDVAVDEVLVRPFLVTGGRTRPLHDGLRLETLVSAKPAALSAPLRFELRRIVELCQAPHSIAEVAVCLGVPVGVARVLVADLVAEDAVSVSEVAELPIEMIERIRDRVRAL